MVEENYIKFVTNSAPAATGQKLPLWLPGKCGGAKVQVTSHKSQVTIKNTCKIVVSLYLVRTSYLLISYFFQFVFSIGCDDVVLSKIPSLRFQCPCNQFSSFFSPTCSRNNVLLMVYWDVTNGLKQNCIQTTPEGQSQDIT